MLQECESEDEALDEGEEDAEEVPEQEHEAPAVDAAENKTSTTIPAPKDPERQLSKKELKKKGLEELDAILAELGLSGQEQSTGMYTF